MKRICFIIFILSSFISYAQSFSPDWYIIEPGCSVGMVKPGINDLMMYATANKTLDRNAIVQINGAIRYSSGRAVLIYAKVNDTYLATDVEGRTIFLKGNVTKAEAGPGSGLGYVKTDFIQDGITFNQAAYVWIKEINKAKATATIQIVGKKTVDVPVDKLYIINETTAEMIPATTFKIVD